MATRIGSLYVTLTAPVSGFITGLNQAQKRLDRFGSQVQSIGAKMVGVSAAMTAPAMLAAKQYAEYGDNVAKMAKRTGIGAQALSEMAHVAELSGSNMQALERGIRGMQRGMFDAQRGTGEMEDALTTLGMTYDDLQGKRPDDQFALIADKIAGIADPSIRAGVAMKVFGRAGAELVPMLSLGSQGIAHYRDEARRLGISMSGEAAAGAELLTDMIARQKAAWKGLTLTVGRIVTPTITDLLTKLTNGITVIRQFIEQRPQTVSFLMDIAKYTAVAGISIIALGSGLKGLSLLLSPAGVFGIGVAVILWWTGALDGALAPWKNFVANIEIGGRSIGEWFLKLKTVWDEIRPLWTASMDALLATFDWFWAKIVAGFGAVWPHVIRGFANAINEVSQALMAGGSVLGTEMGHALATTRGALLDTANASVNAAKEASARTDRLAERMAQSWERVADTAKQSAGKISDSVLKEFKAILGNEKFAKFRDIWESLRKDFKEFPTPAAGTAGLPALAGATAGGGPRATPAALERGTAAAFNAIVRDMNRTAERAAQRTADNTEGALDYLRRIADNSDAQPETVGI